MAVSTGGVEKGGRGAIRIQWEEARNAAKHPTVQRSVLPPTENSLAPNVNNHAKVEKPCY